jgi:hypothetical protein
MPFDEKTLQVEFFGGLPERPDFNAAPIFQVG